MFKELWNDLPTGIKAAFAIVFMIGFGFLGFQIWAIIELIGIARDAVGG